MTAAEGLDVRIARLAEILPLRHAVLRPGRPLASAAFDGDLAATTVLVGALDRAALVGCATVMRRPLDGEDAGQLRGMATVPARVRRGIGTAVLRFVEALAAHDWKVGLLWCNARIGARGFYERRGWRVVSDEFDVPDVGPHVRMVRRLEATGP